MDPVLHESMSPYNAFDNNLVYWADPSGADGTNPSDLTELRGARTGAFSTTASFFETTITNNNTGASSSIVHDGSGNTYTDQNDGLCPSCKTEEDWLNYYSQARNTALILGVDPNIGGGTLTVGYNEDGRRVYFLDGVLQDLNRRENAMDAFFSMFDPGLFLISMTSNLWKIFNFGDEAARIISLTKAKFGHTFVNHGQDATNFIIKRARGSGYAQGQFLDNQQAAKFILENLSKTSNGAISLPIPKGFRARVIMPNGSFKSATHIRLVPGGKGVKTAYPLIE